MIGWRTFEQKVPYLPNIGWDRGERCFLVFSYLPDRGHLHLLGNKLSGIAKVTRLSNQPFAFL